MTTGNLSKLLQSIISRDTNRLVTVLAEQKLFDSLAAGVSCEPMEKIVMKILTFIRATSAQNFTSNQKDGVSMGRRICVTKFIENCLSVEENSESFENQKHSFNVIKEIIKEASNEWKIESTVRDLIQLVDWPKQIVAIFKRPRNKNLGVLPQLLDIICVEAGTSLMKISSNSTLHPAFQPIMSTLLSCISKELISIITEQKQPEQCKWTRTMIGSTVSVRRVAESLEIIRSLQKGDPESVNRECSEKGLTEHLPVTIL